jgi:hypothetical protein
MDEIGVVGASWQTKLCQINRGLVSSNRASAFTVQAASNERPQWITFHYMSAGVSSVKYATRIGHNPGAASARGTPIRQTRDILAVAPQKQQHQVFLLYICSPMRGRSARKEGGATHRQPVFSRPSPDTI